MRHHNSNYHSQDRNPYRHHDYDRSEEENYGNMAGTLSYGIDYNYGPSRADYERYGYLSGPESYAARSGNRFNQEQGPYHQQQWRNDYDDQRRRQSYGKARGYNPEYDALGQAYGYDRTYDNMHRERERERRNYGNRNYRNGNYDQFDEYNSQRGFGSHDYDNYGLSRHGEHSHRGRYSNPGEFYWQP
ncbi:MAG: hypothetical protein LPK19_00310 [Hymenobacteraceae bacterium]|nr:hypothetical protein [Hymenobacteraceae bacterium]MDX5394610.1 hypothetical protein [Hymenobacteraceae bacterium]MDX5510642.1 hypothetical protein [Hymenobacteraceae bacterium]